MSDQVVEPVDQAQESEAIELPATGDAAFGALMDALAPDTDEAQADEGAAEAGADADPAGPSTAAPEGTGATATDAAAQDAGTEPEPSVQADAGTVDGSDNGATAEPGAGDRPASWTQPAADLIPKLGEISTAFEKRTIEAQQQVALKEVREEHEKYFEALEKHPRLLVGTAVPRIGGEGTETLRDTADAREWQEAVKSILVEEVKDRASRAIEENKGFLDTVHASIELFQNNADLVPGTKDFDVELANKFAALAKPYELRVDGKLQGYSIPVQPIINQLRAELTAARATAAKAPAAPAAPADGKAPAKPAAKADPPQAGIQSKAGASSDTDDFSALFGTIGLPNLRI